MKENTGAVHASSVDVGTFAQRERPTSSHEMRHKVNIVLIPIPTGTQRTKWYACATTSSTWKRPRRELSHGGSAQPRATARLDAEARPQRQERPSRHHARPAARSSHPPGTGCCSRAARRHHSEILSWLGATAGRSRHGEDSRICTRSLRGKACARWPRTAPTPASARSGRQAERGHAERASAANRAPGNRTSRRRT